MREAEKLNKRKRHIKYISLSLRLPCGYIHYRVNAKNQDIPLVQFTVAMMENTNYERKKKNENQIPTIDKNMENKTTTKKKNITNEEDEQRTGTASGWQKSTTKMCNTRSKSKWLIFNCNKNKTKT